MTKEEMFNSTSSFFFIILFHCDCSWQCYERRVKSDSIGLAAPTGNAILVGKSLINDEQLKASLNL